ncbi:MAG: sulfotransferase [Verrucomicrobiales bacterium]|nr:sulfotransferase [Verrucomicrobiales bacterium]
MAGSDFPQPSADQLSGRQRFFVFGLNKSGTTFLQSLINSHPSASCPSEHHFLSIWKVINSGLEGYRKVIEDFDEKTSRQGVAFNEEITGRDTYRAWLDSLFLTACREGDTHVGLNDNSLDSNLDFHAELFPDSKFLFILRDPRDVAVSLYYHRKRTEDGFDIPLSRIASSVGKKWVSVIENVTNFSEKYPGRIEIVRYEDLISDSKQSSLSRILKFLGLPASGSITAAMFEANDIARLRKKEATVQGTVENGTGCSPETNYGFYRTGTKGGWREELSEADIESIESSAGRLMKKLLYPLVSQGEPVPA